MGTRYIFGTINLIGKTLGISGLGKDWNNGCQAGERLQDDSIIYNKHTSGPASERKKWELSLFRFGRRFFTKAIL